MGVITVETPNGPIRVQIAGETPTEQEKRAIISGVARMSQTGSPSVVTRTPGMTKPDLATMSPDQIREYVRMRQQAGFDETGQQMSPEEYANVYREEGVDYTQGLQDIGNFSRFGYGRMETDEGRANYLRRAVGEGGYRQDALGRFVLTKRGRQNLGMGEGPELAIDEEGLSWGDFSEFLGQNALPMAAGIGAGLMASGVGILPGLAIAGAAGAAGKALDESIEYAQGLQDQTFQDVMRDVAFEGAFATLGEGVGRVVSKAAGRLIKGPDSEAGEQARTKIRDLLGRGFEPTVSGGGGEDFRPILGRVQGMYEAMFPNKKAAELNAKTIVNELRALRVVDESRLADLEDALKNDVVRIYGTAADNLVRAERILDTTVERSLGKVFSSLRTQGSVPKDIISAVQLSKRLFDENMDSVFTKIDGVLGGQAIIPTAGIKSALEGLVIDSAADIGSTRFARMVADLPQYATVQEISRIRTAISDATANPGLVADANIGSLNALKSSITSALNGTEVFLARSINMPTQPGKALGPQGFTASFEDLSNALGALRRANRLYRKGMARFDNAVTQNIIQQTRREGGVNEKFVFEQIIQKDNPEALRQLLMAVRGTRFMPGLEQGQRTAAKLRVLNMPIESARREMALLPEGSEAKRLLREEIRRVEDLGASSAGAAGRGVERSEELRQNLAKMYLDDVLAKSRTTSESTNALVVDPVLFVQKLKQKGKVFDALFKEGERKQIDDLISVMSRAKGDIAPIIFKELTEQTPSLTRKLTLLRDTQTAKQSLDKNQLMRLAESGDTEALAKALMQSPKNAQLASKNLSSDVMEAVRDTAMNRLLRQAGLSTDIANETKMSETLLDSFASGSLGKSLQGVVNTYGDEALDALFGAGTAKALNGLADDMIRVSDEAIRGKGGLVAASSAAALTGFAILFNPVAVLGAAAVPFVMSKALRDKRVLRLLTASRNKNTVKQLMDGNFRSGDVIGQGVQAMNQIIAQAATYGTAGMVTQGQEEARAMQELARQEAQTARQEQGVQNMLQGLDQIGQQAAQAVTSPMQALAPQAPAAQPPAAAAAPARVNPILVPNPTTRATFGG